MKRGIFVVGTDTGVGKTVVAAALVLALQEEGLDVGVMKPLESGAVGFEGTLIPQDALYLKEISQVQDPIDRINPYRFEAPLAPAVAAEKEGIRVELERIKEAFRELSSRHQFMVVEGVGGLMVPISDGVLLPELIKEFGLPVLLVGRSSLGTINHTLLSLSLCEREGIEVVGFLLNKVSSLSDPSEGSNPASISSFTSAPYLGTFPFLGEFRDLKSIQPFLLSLMKEHINLPLLFERLGISKGRTS